jgi:O-antigen/teichoic acid export membrane protein
LDVDKLITLAFLKEQSVTFWNNAIKVVKKKTFRNTSIVGFSSFLSKIITFITIAVLARQLTVKEYGILTVLLSITITITDLVNSGLNASLIRYTALYKSQNNIEKISRLFSTSLLNVSLISFLAIVSIIIFSPFLSRMLFKQDISSLVALSSIGIVTSFLFSIYSAILQGLQQFSKGFVVNIALNISRLLFIIMLMCSHGLSLINILLVFVLTPLIPALVGHFFLRRLPISIFHYDTAILRETFVFGRWMVLWSIIAVIQARLDIYLLGPLSDPTQVSYYDVAQRFISFILIGIAAYATVLNPKLASLTSKTDIMKETNKAKAVCAIITICLIVSFLVFPSLITAFFGVKYAKSLLPFRILTISLIPYTWCMPFTSALYAIGKSYVFFVLALIGLLLNVCLSLRLVPTFGAIGSAISNTLLNSCGLCVTLFFYAKYFHGREAEVESRLPHALGANLPKNEPA